MRENMDQMLQQVRDYVFQTDEALKESQRSICRVGAAQLETTALKEIRDDIWALEDKVRAAKWATTAAEQAELANQIDPLMLQVMAKCQQHRDQIKACQGLLSDIVSWCERGTSAYRFTIHESAVAKAPAATRYSSSGGGAADLTLQVKNAAATRIPAYKSPTKQCKGPGKQQQAPQQQQQQYQEPYTAGQQQMVQLKAQSRIPQPQAVRKSLPDADQQGAAPDQAGRDRQGLLTANSSTGGGSSSAALLGGEDALEALAPRTSSSGQQRPSAGPVRGSGLVAAAAAAFEGGRSAASSHNGSAAGSSAFGSRVGSAAGAVEPFVPMNLEADDGQLLQPAAAPKAEQLLLQQQGGPAMRPQERLSNSSNCSGSANLAAGLQARGSGGRVPRSLLQLEPSRDDVPLSSAGQLLQQSPASLDGAAAPSADTAAAPAAAPAASVGAAPAAHTALGMALRASASLHADAHARGLPGLKVPRPGYAADAPPADPGSAASDLSEFGPLRTFTPMVVQQSGRCHPFAASGSYADRSSLRTSQDISMLLRSGMLMEAALLSSNASRMHIIHDAVAKKPAKPDGEPEVPVVPPRLAVHKKRPWWSQAARVVVGTAAMAVAGAAGAAAAAKHHQAGDAAGGDQGLHSLLRPLAGAKGGKKQRQRRQQQQQALEDSSVQQLPFVPLGPAPDASAGCG